MKKVIFFFTYLLSITCFAEPLVGKTIQQNPHCPIVANWPVSDKVAFCQQFSEAAYCHCKESLKEEYCKKIHVAGLWQIMMATYGSALAACDNPRAQKDVSTELCVTQWTYYNSLPAAFKIQNKCD